LGAERERNKIPVRQIFSLKKDFPIKNKNSKLKIIQKIKTPIDSLIGNNVRICIEATNKCINGKA
jgi:hypothetical protein